MNTESNAGQQASQVHEKYNCSTLPEFKCHKRVKAMLIQSLAVIPGTDLYNLEGDITLTVDTAYFTKHQPHVGGYYVLYADGYESFSPAKAFEDGYMKVEPMMAAGITEVNAQQQQAVASRGCEARVLPHGTMVHMNGIPVVTLGPALMETHPNNWPLALEKFESEGDTNVTGGTANPIQPVSGINLVRELLKVQGYDGNWNYDPYMHGMYNGLECALATIEGRPCEYRAAPAEWGFQKAAAKPPAGDAVREGVQSDPIEQQIIAKGLTAPRVTPADLEDNIHSEHYFTALDGLMSPGGSGRESPIPGPDASVSLSLLTICVLTLKNGYTVTGTSACASPENFNAELGREIARKDAVRQVWPLMGYALKERLAGRVVETGNYDEPDAPKQEGDFKTRLMQEHSELQMRVEKLEKFLGTGEFSRLPEIERNDLLEQLPEMRLYLATLTRRVSRLCNNA